MRKKRRTSHKSKYKKKFSFFSLAFCLVLTPLLLFQILKPTEKSDSQIGLQTSADPQFPTVPDRQLSSLNSGNPSDPRDSPSPPDLHEVLKKVPDPFQNDPVLSMRETKPDPDGNFSRVKIQNTSFKYPHVRVKENLIKDFSSGEDRVLTRIAMVADHVIVALEPGYTEADLSHFIRSLGYEIRKAKPLSQTYLVSFDDQDVDALDKALAALKKSKIISNVEPDYILYGN